MIVNNKRKNILDIFNENLAIKYIQNKIYLKHNSNDIIAVLYDFLNIE